MISILVFVVLMAGFALLRFKRSTTLPDIVEQDAGFVRSVFPDGTVEDQNENGELIYIFDETNYLRVDSYGDVFRTVNGEVRVESNTHEMEVRGPNAEKLSAFGITTELTPPKMFQKDPAASQALQSALQKGDLLGAEKQLRAMSSNNHLVEIDELFYNCALSTEPEVWDFIQTRLKYTPPAHIWEKVALSALDIKPEHLDVPAPPLSHMLNQPNKEWITNAFIASVLSHRRYDMVEEAFKYGTDFRTHAERTCYHAYAGNDITLSFMEDCGSSVRALALYLAARNEKTGIAKSLVRSFTKEQQSGLKKMFSRLKRNPKQLLKYFT